MVRLPHLLVVLLLVGAGPTATPAPTPPTDPCARTAFDEIVTVQARARALAAGTPTLADMLDLLMDLPEYYAYRQPGAGRFRELFATTDAKEIARLLGEIATDLDKFMADEPWRYRCDAYPSSHQTPAALTKQELTERRALGKRTLAALARAESCRQLVQTVLRTPERQRNSYRGALDSCQVSLNAARARCERDFTTIAHTDAFAAYKANIAVSNLRDGRRDKWTADDVAAARRRIEPMLKTLPEPLSTLAKPIHAAFKRKQPVEVLDALTGTLRTLTSPCERMWSSSSTCLITPDACRKELY